jgi:hypothetical protein
MAQSSKLVCGEQIAFSTAFVEALAPLTAVARPASAALWQQGRWGILPILARWRQSDLDAVAHASHEKDAERSPDGKLAIRARAQGIVGGSQELVAGAAGGLPGRAAREGVCRYPSAATLRRDARRSALLALKPTTPARTSAPRAHPFEPTPRLGPTHPALEPTPYPYVSGECSQVLKGHSDAVKRTMAVEALKEEKVRIGKEMRVEIASRMKEESLKKRERVADSHSKVFEERKKKQGAVRARVEHERKHRVAIGEAAKIVRAQNKERTKATVRKQEQAAKDFAAHVRHETRPEVRQEGRELYQGMRDHVAAAERDKAEMDRREVEGMQDAYRQRASVVKQSVDELRASSRASREGLMEAKARAATEAREKLREARERKEQNDEMVRQAKASLHDDIASWSKQSIVHPGQLESVVNWKTRSRG